MTTSFDTSVRIPIRTTITCPNCWHEFSPEDTLWIASHPALVGDPRVGADEQQRFLPTRFDVTGNAIDSQGERCTDLACPDCHLPIPRAVLELEPFVASVVGAPSCGKSYFLASMTWQTRQTMAREFLLSFTDADTVCNEILNSYEEKQFFNPERDKPVKLAKTAEEGDWYNSISFGDQAKRLPKPFLFSIRPSDEHPNAKYARKTSRLLTIYDNAGESFLPGRDTAVNQVTRHLSQSDVLLFLYDPTQSPAFREKCSAISQDPQVHDVQINVVQERIFHEVASRIRKHKGLSETEKCSQPVIVVVTKYDIWGPLLDNVTLPSPWVPMASNSGHAIHTGFVEEVSNRVRNLLLEYSPELVRGVDAFSEKTLFIPVSATGVSPTRARTKDGKLVVGGIRPQDIQPVWIEVPLIYTLAKWDKYVVPFTTGTSKSTNGT